MSESLPPSAAQPGDGSSIQPRTTGSGASNGNGGQIASVTGSATDSAAVNSSTQESAANDTAINSPAVNGTAMNGTAVNGAGNSRFRIRVGLILTILGFLIFLMGVDPGIFGLDRSPVTGFVQIATFLVGLALMCLGGYTGLNALWNGTEKSIAADIGLRLVATGYVVAVACGMADIFGIGNQPLPQIPYFGPWQAMGVMVGELIIALGFILLIPYRTFRNRAG